MYDVTLVYEDSTTWYAGRFETLDEANAWVDREKTRPYWKATTVVNVVLIS